MTMFIEKLFHKPFSSKIQNKLPKLFSIVALESRRGGKVGMEVGVARERVLVALLLHAFGKKAITLPDTTEHEVDIYIKDQPISIKTKAGSANSGVKIVWTVDWSKAKIFFEKYVPSCHILFVQIIWNTNMGGFYFIPIDVQKEALKTLGKEKYLKIPKRGTNARGIEIQGDALKQMKNHTDSLSLSIKWNQNKVLNEQEFLYKRWIDLWKEK